MAPRELTEPYSGNVALKVAIFARGIDPVRTRPAE